jgi:replication factor C subunit 1
LRETRVRYVERHGGKITGAVSGRTTYLLVGTDTGKTKYNKAKVGLYILNPVDP